MLSKFQNEIQNKGHKTNILQNFLKYSEIYPHVYIFSSEYNGSEIIVRYKKTEILTMKTIKNR